MKKTAILILFVLLTVSSFAQTKGKYSWELGVGFAVDLADMPIKEGHIGVHFVGSYKCSESPFVVGLSLALDRYPYVLQAWDSCFFVNETIPVSVRFFASASSLSAVPFVNYQFIQEEKVMAYVGLGTGVALNSVVDEVFKTQPVLLPRIGVLFYNSINFSFDYYFTGEGFSRLALRLGFSF